MSDTQSANEFRFLDEKRKTTGLTPAEDQRWQELAASLGVDLSAAAPEQGETAAAPQGYYGPDGNWYPYAPQGYDPQVWGGQPGQWQQQQGYYPPQPQGYYGPDGQWYQYPPQPQQYFDPNTGQYYQAPPQQWAYPPQPQGYYDQQGQWVPTAPQPQPQWDPQTQQWVQPQWPQQPEPAYAPPVEAPAPAAVAPAAPAWAPPQPAAVPAPMPPVAAPFSSTNSTPEATADEVMEIHDEEVVEIPLSSPPARKVDPAPAPLPIVPEDPVADLRNALSFDDEPELPALSPIPPPRLELKPAPAEVKIPFVPKPFFPPAAPPAPIPSKSTPSFPLLEMPSFDAPAQPVEVEPVPAPAPAPRAIAAPAVEASAPLLPAFDEPSFGADEALPVAEPSFTHEAPLLSSAPEPITAEVPTLSATTEVDVPRTATPVELPTFDAAPAEPAPTAATDEVPALESFDADVDFAEVESARAPTEEISAVAQPQAVFEPEPVQATFEPEPVQATFEPEPVQATFEPEPVQATFEPEPVQATFEPEPVQATFEPEPVQATFEPEPVQATFEPEPIQATFEPEPIQATFEPEPVQATFEPEPIQATFEPEPVQATLEPEPFEPVAPVAAPATSSPSAFDVLALPPDHEPIPTFAPESFARPIAAAPEPLPQADVFPSWDSVPEPTAEPAFDKGGWSNDADEQGADVVLASNWDAAPAPAPAAVAPNVADDPWGSVADPVEAPVAAAPDEWSDAPVVEAEALPTVEATVIEAELSGSPDDQVNLAGTSDFVSWNQPAEAATQSVEIDADLGEFVVESGSAAALATGTAETASGGFDDQKLELASNVDFIQHEALTSTGEAWQGDGRGVELEDPLEGEVIQGDVIQGEVLQGEVVAGDDVDIDTSEPVADSWGMAVSQPSPVPQRPFVPPLSSPPPGPALGASRVPPSGSMPGLGDAHSAPTSEHVALGGPSQVPGSGSLPAMRSSASGVMPALGASRVPGSGSMPALGDPAVRVAPTGSQPALGDPGVRTSPSGTMPRPPITQTKLPAFDAQQIVEVPMPIPGEHRVILHTMEGGVKRGSIRDADLAGEQVVLHTGAEATESIPRGRVKAVFFMLAPGSRSPPTEGSKVRVTFRDGRQVAGFSKDYRKPGVGFFVVPADNRTNTERIFIYRHSVSGVAVD